MEGSILEVILAIDVKRSCSYLGDLERYGPETVSVLVFPLRYVREDLLYL